jgi:hypothetical protein
LGIFALPQRKSTNDDIVVLREERNDNEDGSYQWAYETSDGSSHSQTGELRAVPDEKGEIQNRIVNTGSYSYIWEGVNYTVNYFADETGYHATVIAGNGPEQSYPSGAKPVRRTG